MSSSLPTSHLHQIELELTIDAASERVWEALTDETDAWWLGDFRAVGADSQVRFDARPGGTLSESRADGSGLVWYQVQMVDPGRSLYLVGHTAPDWGGPILSMLKLALTAVDGGCRLQISDALMGRVGEEQIGQLSEGWKRLFGDGLKRYVEAAADG